MADRTQLLLCSNGPLPDLFAKPLAASGDVTAFDGGQEPAAYDLLVLDGGSLPASVFREAAALAKTALDANKPVVVLSPTDEHKAILAEAGALRTYPNGRSVALLIEPRRDQHGKLRFALAEQHAPSAAEGTLYRSPMGNARRPGDGVDVFKVAGSPVPSTTDMAGFIERVRQSVGSLRAGIIDAATKAGPTSDPDGIPGGLYDVTPVSVYWPLTMSGSEYVDFTPPTGSFTLQGTTYIGIYYDNITFDAPMQWLIIENSGEYAASIQANNSVELGWTIGMLQVNGQSISGVTQLASDSSPGNVSGETTYTSESSFTVGLAAGTDGLTADTKYPVASSVTNPILDWGIVQSSPNTWQFAQTSPYDGSAQSCPSTVVSGSVLAPLPAISVGSLSYDTQATWQQSPPNNETGTVTFGYVPLARFSVVLECLAKNQYSGYCWWGDWSLSQMYTLNWGSAWPTP